MFEPSRDQARAIFFDAWRKYRAGEPLGGIEGLALEVILKHPEYHEVLEHPEQSAQRDYSGELNPFLHMSLHVALEEQLSIDQPPGIAARFEALLARYQDRHEALHQALECLGETVWRAQRDRAAPDAVAYLECLAARALRR
jgi:Domain of unknown function (DUF1841)